MVKRIDKWFSKSIIRYLWITAISLSLGGWLAGCGPGPGVLLRPNGVAVAPDGSLYVMDRGNYRVAHVSAQGEILDSFGQLGVGPEDIYAGWDIELDTTGKVYISNLIPVEEETFQAHDGIKVFTSQGRFVQELGGQDYDAEDPHFQRPYGLDIDRQGRVYVPGFDSNSLRIFTPAGEEIATLFGEKGVEAGQFNGMLDVAVDDERSLLYLTDQFNSRVQQFDLVEASSGELSVRHRLSFGSYGRETEQFAYPQNILVDDRSGRVYVGDMGNRRIQVFDPQGQYLSEMVAPLDWQVIGLDLGPDGAIYAIDARNNLIWVFEPDGRLRQRLEVGS
jgi:tripartite motif-containing protein 71